jgi:hypothetical protein
MLTFNPSRTGGPRLFGRGSEGVLTMETRVGVAHGNSQELGAFVGSPEGCRVFVALPMPERLHPAPSVLHH